VLNGNLIKDFLFRMKRGGAIKTKRLASWGRCRVTGGGTETNGTRKLSKTTMTRLSRTKLYEERQKRSIKSMGHASEGKTYKAEGYYTVVYQCSPAGRRSHNLTANEIKHYVARRISKKKTNTNLVVVGKVGGSVVKTVGYTN